MMLFTAVVREGSFTRAAKKLGVTKQSASDRVAKLEARLGVRLLERTTRVVRPTDVGAAYYERCGAIAAQIEEANREVFDRQSEPGGLLRISAPYLFARRFLSPVLTAYMKRYPNVRVDVALDDRRVLLVDQGFDVALRVGTLEDSSLSVRHLGDFRLSFVASASVLSTLPSARPVQPSSLRDIPCIGLRSRETWSIGEARVKIEPRLVVNDLEIACDAAIAGLGIAMLPSFLAREPLESGALTELWPGEGGGVRAHAVFPSRRYLSAKVRCLLDMIAETGALERLGSAGERHPASPKSARAPRAPRRRRTKA